MKFYAALVIAILAVGLSPARAQSADDQYLIIYSLIQQADTLAGSGDPRQALAQYSEIQGELQKFQNVFPDWNPKIVNFRLKYVAGKISEIEAQFPAAVAPTNSMANATSQISTATNAGSEISNVSSDAELAALRGQVQQLQSDNATLTAKLKEALAVEPAAVDPRELAKAQEQIQSLMKENDLLKADLAQAKNETNNSEATAELVQAQEQVQSLTKENDLLKSDMAQERTNTVLDTNALMEVQAALTEANKKLADQTERADKLASDNAALQTRVQSLLASPGAMDALRDENALLKKQLAESQTSSATNRPEMDRLNSDLKQARLQIATLQSDTQVKQLEKAVLENRIKELQDAAATNPPPASGQKESVSLIRELTQERDDLLAKLGAANKEIYGRNKQGAAAQINGLTDEIKTLRARLAMDEASAVPYTPEELALFKQPAPQLANPDAEKKSINELPGGSAELVAEAQNYFSAKQYDKAAADYQKILQRDENNSLVLGNLAAIEMEQGKLDDAEKHIKAAIAQNPDDAYNLSTLGYLKFRQEKYDEALDALSRAAKLDPQNPEIENYLGVTLSHKGLRAPAEAALRKAILLDPNYAAAHNNLAVIYLNEQPPLVQLARWHYQKALDAGQPHNPDLEKALDAAGAPPSPQ
ncbi:MAG TPA: tetratricopeptide repeat protein [Verrucomicrobiae bacterium]|jgi:tetratricopeptide (TPR) repeat protein|nr:tetratricopeptide repeat protein [Verrucomicrobiae bacterium]